MIKVNLKKKKKPVKMDTAFMEYHLARHVCKTGTYICFEVMIPVSLPTQVKQDRFGNIYTFESQTRERVDLLTYESRGYWRFYELKLTVADFHSKCRKSFQGNYNYYVMPTSVYEKVKDEIPDFVGVYTVDLCYPWITCAKKPKLRELGVDENALKHNFMQALSREANKWIFQEKWKGVESIEKTYENFLVGEEPLF